MTQNCKGSCCYCKGSFTKNQGSFTKKILITLYRSYCYPVFLEFRAFISLKA